MEQFPDRKFGSLGRRGLDGDAAAKDWRKGADAFIPSQSSRNRNSVLIYGSGPTLLCGGKKQTKYGAARPVLIALLRIGLW